MDRRQFVKASTVGMTTLAAGLGITDLNAKSATEPGAAPIAASGDMIGRPVRIVSIGLAPVHLPDIGAPPHPRSLDEIAGLVDKEGARGTDRHHLTGTVPRPGR